MLPALGDGVNKRTTAAGGTSMEAVLFPARRSE
jgi:hypothetical protein